MTDSNRTMSKQDCSELTQTESQFTYDNVKSNHRIKLVDVDEDLGLEQYCYTKCNNMDNDFIKNCRGLVYHNKKLLLKAFPYTTEYTENDSEILQNIFKNIEDWTCFDSYEGSLIRLFYFSGKWFITTHRKLNAFRSKWSSSKSFGEIFVEALCHEAEYNQEFKDIVKQTESHLILDSFCKTLNKDYKYMFLLRNTKENRIVSLPPLEDDFKIFHVGTFTQDNTFTFDVSCVIKPPNTLFFNSSENMRKYVSNISPKYTQGVICFSKDGRQIKVVNSDYLKLYKIRGNEPSIKFRYLQVRKEPLIVAQLCELYPEYQLVFDNYEKIIHNIAIGIYNAYIDRFIRKQYVVVSKEEYAVVSECHSWHLSDKDHNKITIHKVKEVLDKQSAVNINAMIRKYNIEPKNSILRHF